MDATVVLVIGLVAVAIVAGSITQHYLARKRREAMAVACYSGSLPYFRYSSLTASVLLNRLAIASEYVRRPRS